MPSLIDLTGRRFGRLVVVKRDGYKSGRVAWLCRCDCGGYATVTQNCLSRGITKSCGCLANESRASHARNAGMARAAQLRKHGHAGGRLYAVWKTMRQRCLNPRSEDFHLYGGRGIGVCPEWNSYSAFHDWAMSHGYDPLAQFGECTLDRIDNDGDYEPSNCRFVSFKVQANNRRKRGRHATLSA